MPRTKFEDSTVGDTETPQSEPAAIAASFTLPPYLQPFPTITPTTTQPESEQHIAVDPVMISHVVAVTSDFDDVHGGRNVTKYVVSVDSGTTWVEKYMEVDGSGFLRTADGRKWDANSDPVVAVHRSGKVYLANLFLNGVFNSADNSNGIYVSVGDLVTLPTPLDGFDTAHTFPVVVNPSPSTQRFEDKEWLAVDNSGLSTDGNVYVTWTRFLGNQSAIKFSRSVDQGKTWSFPITLNPPGQNGHLQGSQIDIGPKGEVYVLWEFTLFDNSRQIWFIRSLDGGKTWRAPHQITNTYNTVTFGSSYRTNSFAKMRVDKVTGAIQLLWPDIPSFTIGGSINYSHSTDGGVNWAPRTRINDVVGFRTFMPSIAVDESSRIHVSWYDTRNNGTSTQFFDVYAAYSTGGGVWSVNKRVTPVSIDCGVGDRFIGDYNGIRALGGLTHVIWTNGGFNGGRLQVTKLVIP